MLTPQQDREQTLAYLKDVRAQFCHAFMDQRTSEMERLLNEWEAKKHRLKLIEVLHLGGGDLLADAILS